MKTLEEYLRESYFKGTMTHTLHSIVAGDGYVSFYIHPEGIDGDTLNFDVNENQLFSAQIEQGDGTYLISYHGK